MMSEANLYVIRFFDDFQLFLDSLSHHPSTLSIEICMTSSRFGKIRIRHI